MKGYTEGYYILLKSYYNDFVQFGGFPEVTLLNKVGSKKAMLQDILNAYIDMDVKILSDYSLNDELYKLIRLLGARVGSKLDVSKLASVAGINRNKIANYLHLFEQTYFLTKLTPFSNNTDKEISQQPKYYFSDSGLLSLMGIQDIGKVFENTVVNQFMRLDKTINYYQKKTGQEIDLIWKEKFAVEIKTTPTKSDLASLTYRANSVKLKKKLLIGLHPPGNGFNNFVWGGNVF